MLANNADKVSTCVCRVSEIADNVSLNVVRLLISASLQASTTDSVRDSASSVMISDWELSEAIELKYVTLLFLKFLLVQLFLV